MEKRTLTFLLLITFAVFALQNTFFAPKQQVAQTAEAPSRKASVPLSSFPITSLYEEPGSVYNKAVEAGNGYLVELPEKSAPNTLFVKDRSGSYTEIFRQATGSSLLAFYSSEDPSLYSVLASSLKSSELQLITLGKEDDLPSITSGELQNKNLQFPEGSPVGNAIAFYEVRGAFVPVGYYLEKSGKFTALSDVSSFSEFTAFETLKTTAASGREELYVLENDTQQIVFSTKGGAIAEINLPFRSETNQATPVRPISFDRMIKNDHPTNAKFPLFPAWKVVDGKRMLMDPSDGGFYPLLRRDILGKDGKPVFNEPAKYYSTVILSDDEETQNGTYSVRRFEKDLIEFELKTPSRKIIKTYQFTKQGKDAPFCLNLSVRVDGDSRGLFITSGVPEVELISGSSTPSVKYRITRNQKNVVEKVSLPKDVTTIGSVHPDWVSNSNGFFGIILDPLTDLAPGLKVDHIPGNFDPTRLTLIDQQNDLYPADKYPGYQFMFPLPRTNQPLQFRMFAGPLATDVLKEVDATFVNPKTGMGPDYLASQSFQGWFSFISEPFAKFLFLLMNAFYSLTHSWGVAIILLTVALRLMLYPLNAWSIKSTLRMQQVQPLVQKIQEKYKKDPKRAQLETMQLYREKKANPFTGCLPLLIQMPFLIGMFDLLKSTFELRGVAFIPGWINNLTAPDVLFSWHYPIPFFGTNFHLLPILLGVIMFIQQKFMSMTAKTKGPMTDQQKQQQKMGSFMTIIFTVMFYHFPSGLNLYWMSSMALSILQQWYMGRKYKTKPAEIEIVK